MTQYKTTAKYIPKNVKLTQSCGIKVSDIEKEQIKKWCTEHDNMSYVEMLRRAIEQYTGIKLRRSIYGDGK